MSHLLCFAAGVAASALFSALARMFRGRRDRPLEWRREWQ